MGRRPLDLTGHPFGHRTGLRPVGRQDGAMVWLCQCSCGNTVMVQSRRLSGGHTQSCGCLRRKLTGERFSNPGRAKRYAKLRAKGWSLRRIATHCDVSFQAVGHALQKLARRAPSAGALSFTGGRT